MTARFFKVMLPVLLLLACTAAQAQVEEDTVVIRSDDAQPDSEYTTTTTTVVTSPDEEGGDGYRTSIDYPLLAPGAADTALIAVRPLSSRHGDSLRARDEYWYWNYRKKERKKAETTATPSSGPDIPIASVILWIAIIVALIAVIFFILNAAGVRVFERRAEQLVIPSEEDPENEDLFSRNYERDLAAALGRGDYRAAIRLRYLQGLRDLALAGAIEYRTGRSNGSYVSSLWGTPYYKAFFRATRTFEAAWYGMFPVSEELYRELDSDINQLKRPQA